MQQATSNMQSLPFEANVACAEKKEPDSKLKNELAVGKVPNASQP